MSEQQEYNKFLKTNFVEPVSHSFAMMSELLTLMLILLFGLMAYCSS